jgi:hypothetical protein
MDPKVQPFSDDDLLVKNLILTRTQLAKRIDKTGGSVYSYVVRTRGNWSPSSSNITITFACTARFATSRPPTSSLAVNKPSSTSAIRNSPRPESAGPPSAARHLPQTLAKTEHRERLAGGHRRPPAVGRAAMSPWSA